MALLAGALAALALGCGSEDGGSPQRPGDVRVAAVIKGLDNPFFVTMRDGLVGTARRHGVRLRVAAAPAGLQDTAGQATDLENLAAEHPSCYVINPINRTNLVPALSRLPEKAPIIDVDSVVDKEAAKAVGAEITSYIGTDNVVGGRLGADAMAALVHRGARVAVVTGIPGDVGSGLRANGFEDGVKGRFKVVESVAADFEREKARLAAAELLRVGRHIDGFFAVNDQMALGVADAVRAAGRRDKVAVVGFDGIREALTAVKRGALSATVAQYPYTMGQLAVEACAAAVRGKSLPSNVDAPIEVVSRKNVGRVMAKFPGPVGRFDDPFTELLGE